MAKKVVHLKLVNGEEILGKAADEYNKGSYITLEKVRSLTIQPTGPGQVGIGMLPFMVGDPEGEIKIPTHHIIGDPVGDVPKQLEDAYLQQVSGLAFATQAAPKSGDIIT